MLKIVTAPNLILTAPAKPVINFDKRWRKIIKEMEETLAGQTNPQGVGLAAPQVKINFRLFIIKPTQKSLVKVFINPRILKSEIQKKSKQKQVLEGCLSIPKIWGPIKRAKKLLLEYQDPTGAVVQRWFSGFEAMIIQHEVDHLNGILFTQRALEQKCQLYEEKEGKLEKLSY